ncbi:MAG: tetrathionate reductase family octaheme c-type cytochrome [Betaproteobacteria bacterium]|nr:MAG: tetrathionate reductase family octaheme c-type cytochrome [Betaproteobacteria bacterium]
MTSRASFGMVLSRASGLLALLIAVGFGAVTAAPAQAAIAKAAKSKSTADHSKFKELEGPFATGPEVTKACLACHTEAAKQLHKTTHWTWEFYNEVTRQQLGKKTVVNNFCVAVSSNWPRCTSCHIGYGWKDDKFDFTAEQNVDCLICHDTTGGYKKFPAGAGHPVYEEKEFPAGSGNKWRPPDLVKIAQSVGKTRRANCGACHFYGGGGDAVKHGDLDSTMSNPGKELDVHMDVKGLNFSCAECHTTGSHEVTGSRYATKAVDKNGIDVPGRTDDTRASCESCHGLMPHKNDEKLNDHTDRVACPTCHVPEFARGGRPTKMLWDWSTAGKLDGKGNPLKKKTADGKELAYDGMKGDFKWEENVVPEYRWFNGVIKYTLMGEKFEDTGGVVPINRIEGSSGDPDSRIWPFKLMRGKQPYDKKHRVLTVPHVFGQDEAAFWKTYDWPKALAAGMQSVGLEFSGEYGFVETEYYWPIVHMVAPKEKAVACDGCHAREGRLAKLGGFYMPGRDTFPWLDRIGWALVLLTLAGVVGHGLLRLLLTRKG